MKMRTLASLFVVCLIAAVCVPPAVGLNVEALKKELTEVIQKGTGTKTKDRLEQHTYVRNPDGLLDKSDNVVTGTLLDTPIPEGLGGSNGASIYTGFQIMERFANRLSHLVFGSELKDIGGVELLPSTPRKESRKGSIEFPRTSTRDSESSVSTGCEPGRMETRMKTLNTCRNGKQCYAHRINCPSSVPINVETTAAKQLLDNNDKCNVTQAICDGIVVDFQDQFGLSGCVVTDVY